MSAANLDFEVAKCELIAKMPTNSIAEHEGFVFNGDINKIDSI